VHRQDRDPASAIRFRLKVQRGRLTLYTLAFLVAVVLRLLGAIGVPWLTMVLLLAAVYAVTGGILVLCRRGISHLGPIPVDTAWMAFDIGMITYAVYISGGSTSTWFPWYIANVAAVAYVAGARGALIIASLNILAYFGMIAATEPLTAATLSAATTNVLVLSAAAFFAIKGIVDLRRRRLEVSDLRRQAEARADELEQLTGQLRDATFTDSLTGVRNRRYFKEQIETEVLQVRRHYNRSRYGVEPLPDNRDLGFLLLDIDHFKAVQRHVRPRGRETRALAAVGRTLREAVRDVDYIVRWGGEEFLVVVRETNHQFLTDVAERVRTQIASLAVPTGPRAIRVTCSVGYSHYALFEPATLEWADIIQIADRALYLAKNRGRNLSIGITAGARPIDEAGRQMISTDVDAAIRAGYLQVIRPPVDSPRSGT
jgi:diguanylate cyclase (GGDEF)-like protein